MTRTTDWLGRITVLGLVTILASILRGVEEMERNAAGSRQVVADDGR